MGFEQTNYQPDWKEFYEVLINQKGNVLSTALAEELGRSELAGKVFGAEKVESASQEAPEAVVMYWDEEGSPPFRHYYVMINYGGNIAITSINSVALTEQNKSNTTFAHLRNSAHKAQIFVFDKRPFN
jgi:hypothetical protein